MTSNEPMTEASGSAPRQEKRPRAPILGAVLALVVAVFAVTSVLVCVCKSRDSNRMLAKLEKIEESLENLETSSENIEEKISTLAEDVEEVLERGSESSNKSNVTKIKVGVDRAKRFPAGGVLIAAFNVTDQQSDFRLTFDNLEVIEWKGVVAGTRMVFKYEDTEFFFDLMGCDDVYGVEIEITKRI